MWFENYLDTAYSQKESQEMKRQLEKKLKGQGGKVIFRYTRIDGRPQWDFYHDKG